MSRNEEFHLGRKGPGWYEGHGYMIARREGQRLWDIHYPNAQGEYSRFPEDTVGDLSTAKQWARKHWENNR